MKKQFVKALARISLVVAIGVLTVGSTQGQTLRNPLRVNIPFDFHFAGKKLPAGEYSVGRAAQYASDTVLSISSIDGRQIAVRLTNSVHALATKEKGTLVFHRYGDEHFLYQVWPAGAQTGRVLVKSRRERELEQKAQDIARTPATNAPITRIVIVVSGSK